MRCPYCHATILWAKLDYGLIALDHFAHDTGEFLLQRNYNGNGDHRAERIPKGATLIDNTRYSRHECQPEKTDVDRPR